MLDMAWREHYFRPLARLVILPSHRIIIVAFTVDESQKGHASE